MGNSWWLDNSTLYDAIFTVYDGLVEDVHAAGAKNFLFLTTPPVNRSPLILNQADSAYAVEHEGIVIADWNSRVGKLAEGLKARHSGVSVFVHDTWGVFDKVIADPKSFVETEGVKNVTGFCKAYAKYVFFLSSPFWSFFLVWGMDAGLWVRYANGQ